MSSMLNGSEVHTPQGSDTDHSDITTGRASHSFSPVTFAVWLIGMGVAAGVSSFMLLYERVQLWQNPDHVTACDVNPWVSCGEVMASWQASTFGFPNIFLGVIGFPLLIAVGVSVLATAGRLPRWYYLGLQLGVTFAAAFCVWLWFSAVFVIGVLCPYCMVVWASVIPLFVVTTVHNLSHGIIPSSERVRRFANDWWWVVIVLLYLLVIVSIVLRFAETIAYGL